jgi:hypothetical protein
MGIVTPDRMAIRIANRIERIAVDQVKLGIRSRLPDKKK